MSRAVGRLRLSHERADGGASIPGGAAMKFMLMMHATRGKGDWSVLDWPPADFKAHIEFMIRFNKELTEAGELASAEGLAGPGETRVVRATKDGSPAVTDGPFPEAKEFLA